MAKTLTFSIWNDSDPNDNFSVTAETQESALFKALAELGWCISAGSECEEEEPQADEHLAIDQGAYDDGYNAYYADRGENPYDKDSQPILHSSWEKGWNAADWEDQD